MYSGKTVLITGATRGVGKGLIDHFQNNNALVVGLSKSDAMPDNCDIYMQCDLSDPKDIEEAFKNLKDGKFNIDIVINNAAVMTSMYAVKMKTENAQAMIMTNLLGPFLVCREALKFMMDIPYGRIINIGSIADVYEAIGDSIYAACKAGLKTMTNVFAKEFARDNITCNTLAISAIDTDMLAQHKPETVDAIVKTFPLRRKATMEDITNVIDFFCSEKSGYITAQSIYLGGIHD